jgi:hypothetical protein
VPIAFESSIETNIYTFVPIGYSASTPNPSAGERKVSKAKNDFHEAADYLAAECQNRQWNPDVTEDDAVKATDPSVIEGWITFQMGCRTAQNLCLDVIEHVTSRMTDAEAKELLKSLPGLRECVAEDLRYEAQKLIDSFDPTDSEMSRGSYAAWVDDPLIADQRHIARSYRNA